MINEPKDGGNLFQFSHSTALLAEQTTMLGDVYLYFIFANNVLFFYFSIIWS